MFLTEMPEDDARGGIEYYTRQGCSGYADVWHGSYEWQTLKHWTPSESFSLY